MAETKLIELIKLSIVKGYDLSFEECPDFHDGVTFNIFLSKNDKWEWESNRLTMTMKDISLVMELNKAILWLSDKER